MAVKKSNISVRNTKINTFRFNSNSAQRYYNEVQRQGDNLRQVALKEGAKLNVKAGEELALQLPSSSFLTFDEKGRPDALNLDPNLGTIATETFQKAVDERFVQEWSSALKRKSAEIYTSSLTENQPNAVFKTKLSNFIDTHIQEVDDTFYKSIVERIGIEHQAEYAQKYELNKTQRQLDNIAQSKIEHIAEQTAIYKAHLINNGPEDLKTEASKESLENLISDPLYQRLVSSETKTQISNNIFKARADASHESIISYLLNSNNKMDSTEIKRAYESIQGLSRGNNFVKEVIRNHPELLNDINTLYDNTDKIGLSSYRRSLGNRSSTLITDYTSALTSQLTNRSITSSSLNEIQFESQTDYSQFFNNYGKNFESQNTNHLKLAQKYVNNKDFFDKIIDKNGDSNIESIDEFLKKPLSNSILRGIREKNREEAKTRYFNKKFTILINNGIIEGNEETWKENYKKSFNQKANVNYIIGGFTKALKNPDFTKRIINENSLDQFTKVLQLGNVDDLSDDFPIELKDLIKTIWNSEAYIDQFGKNIPAKLRKLNAFPSSDRKEIIEAVLNNLKIRKQEISKQIKLNQIDEFKEIEDQQNKNIAALSDTANNLFVESTVPSEYLLTEKRFEDIDSARINMLLANIETANDDLEMLKTLTWTEDNPRIQNTINSMQEQINSKIYSTAIGSYIDNINISTKEGMDTLIKLQQYLEPNGKFFKNKDILDSKSKLIFNELYENIKTYDKADLLPKLDKDLTAKINTIIQSNQASQKEIDNQNSIKKIRAGTANIQGDTNDRNIANQILNPVAFDKNNLENLAYKEKLELINFLTRFQGGTPEFNIPFKLFVRGSLPDSEALLVFKNLQWLTVYEGNQGAAQNVQLKKMFPKELASELDAILTTADLMGVPSTDEDIGNFLKIFSNIQLSDKPEDQKTSFMSNEDYTKVINNLTENLISEGLRRSQINEILTETGSTFLVEMIFNRLETAKRNENELTENLIEEIAPTLSKRILNSFPNNLQSEALLTGFTGDNHKSDKNVTSTFPEFDERQAFLSTVSSETRHMIKPVRMNKFTKKPELTGQTYLLSSEYNNILNSLPAEDRKEFRDNHIETWIAPNIIIKGAFPMYQLMFKQDNILKPVRGQIQYGEKTGEIYEATWDSYQWSLQNNNEKLNDRSWGVEREPSYKNNAGLLMGPNVVDFFEENDPTIGIGIK